MAQRTLAEAVVDIKGRMDHLERSLKQAEHSTKAFTQRASASLEKFGKSMERVGRRMTMAITLPLALLGRKMAMTASRAEESAAKFNAVFKEEAPETLRWIDELAKRFKRSRYAMIDFAANFQDTFVPMGLARKEAARLSRGLTELVFDLASFRDIAESDVAQGLISGLVGMHRALYKFGVVIREDTLTQEIFNLGLATTKKEITEQMKVLARFNMIMRMTKDAHGDVVRTAESFKNKLRALGAEAEDASVSLGNLINKSLKPLIDDLTKSLEKFNELSEASKRSALNTALLVAAIGPLIYVGGKLLLIGKKLGVLIKGLIAGVKVLGGPATTLLVLGFGAIDRAIKDTARTTEMFRDGLASLKKEALDVGKALEEVSAVALGFRDAFEKAATVKGLDKARDVFVDLWKGGALTDAEIVKMWEAYWPRREQLLAAAKAKGGAAEMRDIWLSLLTPGERQKEAWLKEQVGILDTLQDRFAMMGVGADPLKEWADKVTDQLSRVYDTQRRFFKDQRDAMEDQGDAMEEMSRSWMTPLQEQFADLQKRARDFLGKGVGGQSVLSWYMNELKNIRRDKLEMGIAMQPQAQWIGGPEQIWKRAMGGQRTDQQLINEVREINQKINTVLTSGLPEDALANARFH